MMFTPGSRWSDEYARKGYVNVDLFTADEVEALLNITQRESPGYDHMPFVATIMSRDQAHRRAVDRALREICEPVVERVWPGAQLVLCQINDKRPVGTDSVVGLHQDWSITDETRYRAIGLFCPLVNVDGSNGALFGIPGTHRLPCIPRSMYDVQPYPELQSAFLSHAELLPMRAGQCCAHELMVYHGSVPNLTSRARPAIGLLLAERDAPLRHYVREADDILEYVMRPTDFLDLCYGMSPVLGAPLSRSVRVLPPLTERDIATQVAAVQ
jgi:Phytanoyl-CoA dioxygenase (PhyH)